MSRPTTLNLAWTLMAVGLVGGLFIGLMGYSVYSGTKPAADVCPVSSDGHVTPTRTLEGRVFLSSGNAMLAYQEAGQQDIAFLASCGRSCGRLFTQLKELAGQAARVE